MIVVFQRQMTRFHANVVNLSNTASNILVRCNIRRLKNVKMNGRVMIYLRLIRDYFYEVLLEVVLYSVSRGTNSNISAFFLFSLIKQIFLRDYAWHRCSLRQAEFC